MIGLLAACSDGKPRAAPCEDDECGLDATAPAVQAKPDAGRRVRDGGVKMATFVPQATPGELLQAQVQVNGANVTCGQCAVLIGQVQGGVAPYIYEWSDPKLVGPGPHQVCPSGPTTYSLIVSDSSEQTFGEFARGVQEVEAKASVDCVADAGTEGLTGCFVQGSADAGVGDPDANMVCPQPNDAGIAFDFTTGLQGTVTVSAPVPGVFKAGRTYEYSHDRLLPFTISVGQGLSVDLYGAREPCLPVEKFMTLNYDIFTWHQASCFTPKEDYAYMIVAVHIDGVLASWEFLTSGTLCSGCSQK